MLQPTPTPANPAAGRTPSYATVHRHARATLGTNCANCGTTQRLQAALRPDAPTENLRTDRRSGLRYSVDPVADYQAMCPRCHWWQDQAGTSGPVTHCSSGHEYTPENTRYRQVRGKAVRQCRSCYVTRYRQASAALRNDPERYAAALAYNRARATTPEYREQRNAKLRAARAAARPTR